jgi:trehalose 2-sulfotransferase
VAGVPREYLSRPEKFGAKSPETYGRFIQHVKRIGSTPNGVFGAKIFWFQLAEFGRILSHVPHCENLSFDRTLATIFPRLSYIRLQRRDKLRQAISYYRAAETSIWSNRTSRPRYADHCYFDAKIIGYWRYKLTEWENGWDNFFEERRITPLTIIYEDMIDHWTGTVNDIIAYLGIERSNEVVLDPIYAPQSDAKTDEWVRLFNDTDHLREG